MAVYFGDVDVVKEWRARDEQEQIKSIEVEAMMWGRGEEYKEERLKHVFYAIDEEKNNGYWTTKIDRPYS